MKKNSDFYLLLVFIYFFGVLLITIAQPTNEKQDLGYIEIPIYAPTSSSKHAFQSPSYRTISYNIGAPTNNDMLFNNSKMPQVIKHSNIEAKTNYTYNSKSEKTIMHTYISAPFTQTTFNTIPVKRITSDGMLAYSGFNSYSFDDNNIFNDNVKQRGSDAPNEMQDSDNQEDTKPNALSLNAGVGSIAIFGVLYFLYLLIFGYIKKHLNDNIENKEKIKLYKHLILLFIIICGGFEVSANNIIVSNVAITAKDTIAKYRDIRFDIQWDNSWRIADGPANYDAAWVFIKYSNDKGLTWKHARIHNSSHVVGIGTAAEFIVGLQNPDAVYHSSSNPVLGVFMQRTSTGVGNFANTGSTLRWYFGNDGVRNTDPIMLKVFAIEMVYVPQAAFYAGDGASSNITGQLCDAANPFNPYLISSEAALTLGGTASGNVGNNNREGMDPGGLDDFSTSTIQSLPATFPKGYKGFYSMKYEVSQQQYVDFLNTLTRAQQNNRTGTNLASGITTITNRYVMTNTTGMSFRNGIRCDATIDATTPINFYCDGNGNGIGGEANDGLAVACNFLKWVDALAFADWAGLRPMTELEFEKASRGPVVPLANEYSWGSTNVNTTAIGLSNTGTYNEQINVGFDAYIGNACYSATSLMPMKVGVFAANSNNTGRVSAGASFYGIMELSGNLWERTVMIGMATGRAYAGNHGDGTLSANGNANQATWPGISDSEVTVEQGGFRGGAIEHPWQRLRVSDRNQATKITDLRYHTRGFRAVRTFTQP